MEKRTFQYYPIALFSSVMGFAAVTIAVRQIETLYHMNHLFSILLLVFTSVWFMFNVGILLLRLFKYPKNVKNEFNHPIAMNFFAAISISLLLLATSYINILNTVSFVLWTLGALLQISLTVIFLTKLIHNNTFQIGQFTPVSFIPIVGNLVVPIAGSYHVHGDINWFFFSVGALFSIIYMTLIFYRLFFHAPLPGKLMPTLFILLAPPSVGFVAYINIVGQIDVFAQILYGIAFFIMLFLLPQLQKILTLPFSVPAWALLFPSSAFTIATIIKFRETGIVFYEWLFFGLIGGLILLICYLVLKTIHLMKKGVLFTPDH